MFCWKCGTSLNVSEKKLPFRSMCDHCGSWQHVCVNCQHYYSGMPNDCSIPDTEFVADREKANFCEEFSLKDHEENQGVSASDIESLLFGESDSDDLKGKDKFNSLFNDE